jgi:hypothetical protein
MNGKANTARAMRHFGVFSGLSFLVLAASLAFDGKAFAAECNGAVDQTYTAEVVVFDTPMFFNRLGAHNPNWIMYALKRDVIRVDVNRNPTGDAPGTNLLKGFVALRPDKRPRPLVLRVPECSNLQITFTNLLDDNANPLPPLQPPADNDNQVVGRYAGVHVAGMQLVGSMASDGSNVGAQGVVGVVSPKSGLVEPGDTITYTLYAEHEGGFLLSNPGATFGGEATGGNTGVGMLGMVAVQPRHARIYRSQVTEEELRLATTGHTSTGHPIINYEKRYPNSAPWSLEGKGNLPVLNMMDGTAIVHSEINAIVVGPGPDGMWGNADDGPFPASTYPLESGNQQNPSVPNRLEPFRDFGSVWHDENAAVQAFPALFNDPVLGHTLHSVRDSFMINYGSGGIGSEIVANRVGVGPMYDCLGCAYEEFFLTAFTVGDPAMLVDMPANTSPGGAWATEALFPEDPANVHHSYVGDKVKFRNVHGGPKEQHIFHLHNHQWLFNANDDNSNYLDAQGIGPGSSYTYEINFGGSGNRNKTTGDAIFHCHFYPHFAQGMWYLWRIHDVMETGTVLAVSNADDAQNPTSGYHAFAWDLQSGRPEAGARATPDGEIVAGTPIPAVVPLPGKPMAPMPGEVTVVAKDANGDGLADSSQANVIDRTRNPGFPFWVAGVDCGGPGHVNTATGQCDFGIVGQRPPTPQLDMLPVAAAQELLGLVMGVPGDPFYMSFCGAGGCAAGDPFTDSFVNAAGGFDGGLPRHSLDGCKAAAVGTPAHPASSCASTAGVTHVSSETRLDFHKEVKRSKVVVFPEKGTDLEKVAMGAHAIRNHPSTAINLDGTTSPGNFVLNGGPPVPGAPYNEPCIDDLGQVFYSGDTGNFFNEVIGGTGNTGTAEFGADKPRTYKAANIQIDAVFNKVGYHYPQQRIIALWGDVEATINKTRAPEPFVMRLNTFDCAKYLHSNLVPKEFEVDDYQVRTPTDIIGQHIHLPKWDLTTADGAANGWNYEDGTLSPGMVVERIEAIDAFNGTVYTPQPHPVLGSGVGDEWLGSRVTTQRWFVDPVYNTEDVDRGLGIVFTHDNYGPSTFQQIGLYATLLVEPAGSTWQHNATGTVLGGQTPGDLDGPRDDGGPTSWQAVIIPGDLPANNGNTEAFREFYFEYSDFQHAYEAGVYVGAGPDGRPFTMTTSGHNANGSNKAFPVTAHSFRNAINPSYREQAVDNNMNGAPEALPDIVRFPAVCPGGMDRPCPEAISADDVGMLVVNYRNEPIGLRVFDPDATGPDGKPGTQTAGFGGDLAFALATPPLLAADAATPIAGQPPAASFRAISQMNVQPVAGAVAVPAIPIYPTGRLVETTFADSEGGDVPYNLQAALIGGDPYTPLLRTYPGDLVKIKIQTGATEHEHSGTVHGVKWTQAGSAHGLAPNSGWRNSQNGGISEQFTMRMPLNSDPNAKRPGALFDERRGADYLYSVDASQDGYWSGMWGILRSYTEGAPAGAPLVQLPDGFDGAPRIDNRNDFAGVCEKTGGRPRDPIANLRSYQVIAIAANEVLDNQLGATLVPTDSSATMHVGVQPDPNGGTLVYNPRGGTGASNMAHFQGPLHDPTALLFVRPSDLEPDPAAGDQGGACNDTANAPGTASPACKVRLKADAPLEPLILRANAGECVEVTLFNRLQDQVPDLAGYNTLLQMVIRDRLAPGQMGEPPSVTTFNNNLIRPSSYVGLHAQLVEYDITQHDGTVVGGNIAGGAVVGPVEVVDGTPKLASAPFRAVTYRWYAGDLAASKSGSRVSLVATPVEFGGSNLSPADKIKQGQKAMVGALVIEPENSTWPDALASLTDHERNRQQSDPIVTRKTRADVTVTGGPTGPFDDLVVVIQKGLNHRYKGGTAVENIAGEGGLIPEDSHDSGQAGVNYGTEPAWYRFGLPANTQFSRGTGGLGDVPNPEDFYANALAGEDPATPVYDVPPNVEARMRVLEPTGVGRGTTFTAHGHVWQRDPYLAGAVPSQTIGHNPIGMWLGGQESVTPAQHFEVRLENTGGANGITGDYLFRDQASFGNTDGIWGLMRVITPLPPLAGSGDSGGSGGGKGGGKKKK